MPGLVAGVDSLDAGHQGARRGARVGRRRGAPGRAPHPVDGDGRRARDAPRRAGGTRSRARCARPAARPTSRRSRVAGPAARARRPRRRRPRAAPRACSGTTRAAPRTPRRWSPSSARSAGPRRIGVVPVASFTVVQVGVAAARGAAPRRPPRARPPAARPPHLAAHAAQAATDRGDASGTGWWSSALGGLQRRRARPARRRPRPGAAAVGDRRRERPRARCPPARPRQLGLPAGIPVGRRHRRQHGRRARPRRRSRAPRCSRSARRARPSPSSDRRPVDASGIVAGFADASGRYLPLACTLNARWPSTAWRRGSGSSATTSSPAARSWCCRGSTASGRRTCRTPPARSTACGTAPTRGQILRATYDGAIAGLLDAIAAIGACSSGVAEDAPLLLIGGGAQGAAWRDAVLRLSGRARAGPGGRRSSWPSARRSRPPAC